MTVTSAMHATMPIANPAFMVGDGGRLGMLLGMGFFLPHGLVGVNDEQDEAGGDTGEQDGIHGRDEENHDETRARWGRFGILCHASSYECSKGRCPKLTALSIWRQPNTTTPQQVLLG